MKNKYFKKNYGKNGGITLIALVITVIIILIIAAMALSGIAGGDGLILKAAETVGIYKRSAEEEANLIGDINDKLKRISGKEIIKIYDGKILFSDGLVRQLPYTEGIISTSEALKLAAYNGISDDNFFSKIRVESFNNDIIKTKDGNFIMMDENENNILKNIDKRIVKLERYDKYSQSIYALDEDGDLWTFGDNTYGQIGNGTSGSEYISTPYKVTAINKKIVEFQLSSSNILALDEEGSLWAWGANAYGQIGNGTTTNVLSPHKITTINRPIQEFKNVGAAIYALDVDGNLWGWGYNYRGQFMTGTTKNTVSTPIIIKNSVSKFYLDGCDIYMVTTGGKVLSNITDYLINDRISYSTSQFVEKNYSGGAIDKLYIHNVGVFILNAEGELWGYGFNSRGEIGVGNTTNQTSFVKVNNIDKKIKKLNYNNYSYSFYALDEDGGLWSWGINANGQLGLGNTSNQYSPQKVSSLNKKVEKVFLFSKQLFIIDEDGAAWACGDNSDYKLGIGMLGGKITTLRKLATITSRVEEINSSDTIGTSMYAIDGLGKFWVWGRSLPTVTLNKTSVSPICLSNEIKSVQYKAKDFTDNYIFSEKNQIYTIDDNVYRAYNSQISKLVSRDLYIDDDGNTCDILYDDVIFSGEYKDFNGELLLDNNGIVSIINPYTFVMEQQVELSARAKQISTKYVLDENGEVWLVESSTPQKINFGNKIISIASNDCTISALDENNKVWVLGCYRNNDITTPLCITDFEYSIIHDKEINSIYICDDYMYCINEQNIYCEMVAEVAL